MSLADLYMTPSQAASALSVNRLTVRRWVASGRVLGERVGTITLIWRADIEREARARGIAIRI